MSEVEIRYYVGGIIEPKLERYELTPGTDMTYTVEPPWRDRKEIHVSQILAEFSKTPAEAWTQHIKRCERVREWHWTQMNHYMNAIIEAKAEIAKLEQAPVTGVGRGSLISMLDAKQWAMTVNLEENHDES